MEQENKVTIFTTFADHIDVALNTLIDEGLLPSDIDRSNVTIEPPRDASHGDISTNAAMVLSKAAKKNPREIAQALAVQLEQIASVTEVEIAGPGFINMRLDNMVWRDEMLEIAKRGDDYGRASTKTGNIINVEYVSTNPTGPLHMGHCRGAVVGDALATILEFAGNDVIREYYINDAGGQVDTLSRSAYLRYLEALGRDIGAIEDGLYPGDYLIPVGKRLAEKYGDKYADAPESDWLVLFREEAVNDMMDMIRDDLALLGIKHDVFASEAALHVEGKADIAEKWLRDNDLVYDGVLEKPKGKTIDDWEPVTLPLFRSTKFGDDQDRPIKKSNGQWTYFGADLAYHYQKSESADALINIWGADHAGTVKRIKAAVSAMTQGKTDFDIKLVQMVRLLRGGEPVKMSKRSGSFITLKDVIDEVGKDVVRFTMLTRKADAQMDFDFAKVVEASKDNPVFYVQYAHARICSTLRKALDEDIVPSDQHLELLEDEEYSLVKEASNFSRLVEAAAKTREPHRIAFYLNDLASALHSHWNLGNDRPDKRFILAQEKDKSAARLFMASQIAQVLKNGLRLMGVEASEAM